MRGPLVALACLLSGCGLIMNGTTQTVLIDSLPAGAVIDIDGARHQTPTRVSLKRSRQYVVRYSAPNGATVARALCAEAVTLPHVLDFMSVPFVFNVIDRLASADREFPESLALPLPPADASPEFRSETLTCPK